MNLDKIGENLADVRARIDAAAQRAGRRSADITLVAVTKGVPPEAIRKAQELGIQVFAENRVQDAQGKIHEIPAEWQMIGHLQSNKVASAVNLFRLIQSVDSVRLAEKINEELLTDPARIYPILLEVNISGESQKYGFPPEEIYTAIDAMKDLSQIRIEGLMGIAPNVPDPESRRASFKKLRNVFSACKSVKGGHVAMKTLSMGMSDDFEIAIEEGSTMVRLGRLIFGERKG